MEAGTDVATAQVVEVVDAEGEETRCTSGVKMVVSGNGKMNGKRVEEFAEVKRKQQKELLQPDLMGSDLSASDRDRLMELLIGLSLGV